MAPQPHVLLCFVPNAVRDQAKKEREGGILKVWQNQAPNLHKQNCRLQFALKQSSPQWQNVDGTFHGCLKPWKKITACLLPQVSEQVESSVANFSSVGRTALTAGVMFCLSTSGRFCCLIWALQAMLLLKGEPPEVENSIVWEGAAVMRKAQT